MVTGSNAARHLHIDNAVAYAIAGQRFAHHDFHGSAAHWGGNAQFCQRAFQAVEMGVFVNQPRIVHGTNLIHAIGKLIAAILDMNAGHIYRLINAVYIGNARHANSIVSATGAGIGH